MPRVLLSSLVDRASVRSAAKFDACARALFISAGRYALRRALKRERERERMTVAEEDWAEMEAKYREGCQVAETAAAPLSTGTARAARGGRAKKGWQGRVIDRGWKGCRCDAPNDVIARYELCSRRAPPPPPNRVRASPCFDYPALSILRLFALLFLALAQFFLLCAAQRCALD